MSKALKQFLTFTFFIFASLFAGIQKSFAAEQGEVSGRSVSEEQMDAESELFEELQAERAEHLKKAAELQSRSDVSYGKGRDKSRAPRAVRVYPVIHIEILKVKVDSRGNVTDSILGVTGADGEEKEIVLVTLDGQLTHVWATSTAQSYKQRYHKRLGMIYPNTPEGRGYKPHSLVRYKSSTAYGNGKTVNMPYAIFFNGGIALHGTTADHYNELGVKDSGGCSRLYQPNASILWNYVNPEGREYMDNTVNASVLEEIKSRVTIDVYGFTDHRTSPATRAALRAKYEASIPWIQQELRANLAQIKARK